MQLSKEELCRKLICLGRMDERHMYTYTNAKRLPDGGYGYCLVSMTQDTLYITDVVGMSMELGELLYAIPISQMENKKHTPRISLSPAFRFTWNGQQVILGAVSTQMKKILSV